MIMTFPTASTITMYLDYTHVPDTPANLLGDLLPRLVHLPVHLLVQHHLHENHQLPSNLYQTSATDPTTCYIQQNYTKVGTTCLWNNFVCHFLKV